MSQIATKTGDGGLTSLWSGERVRKDDLRVEAYGTLDELSSFLGEAKHHATLPAVRDALEVIQKALFRACAELASRASPFPDPIRDADEEAMTVAIEALEERLGLSGFVIPGSTPASAKLDVCRTVCRRAERRIATLAREDEVAKPLRRWVNRLSDYLFVLAREEERSEGKLTYAPRGSASAAGEGPA